MKPISDILQKCVFENTTCSFVHFGFSHSKSIENSEAFFGTYYVKNIRKFHGGLEEGEGGEEEEKSNF